jgi:hypothetical protein
MVNFKKIYHKILSFGINWAYSFKIFIKPNISTCMVDNFNNSTLKVLTNNQTY